MDETTYCARHSDTPTRLRCSRCDTPVCPQCLVHSPVGVRCPDCGKGVRLPAYEVARSQLLRAVAASILLGIVGGAGVALVLRPLALVVSPLIYIAAVGGLGYLLGEAVSRSANRKRGRTLQYVAAAGIVASAATFVGLGAWIILFDLVAWGVALYLAIFALR